jgi:MOSC domain-containing protein YiiM
VYRRNLVVREVDLNALIGREFEVQGVRFLGMAEAKPCYWMDEAFAPGAEEALKGQGGLRAKVLTSGTLRRDVA